MAETTLNALSRDLRALFVKGQEALQRDNFGYAIDLFNQVLIREPGLYEARRALRIAQARKAGSGGGFFKKLLSSAGSSPQVAKAQMALLKDPREALQLAEHVLNADPNNSGAHKIIIEAARRLEMPYTAMISLEAMFKNSPKDKDIAIQFANSLAETGDTKLAETILGELHRIYPGDNELAMALKDISARKTLDEGGYEALSDGTGSYRDILKDKAEAAALEQENRQVKTEDVAERLIREYETRLKTSPGNVKLLRDLAELYTQKKQFDKALDYYQQIKATDIRNDVGLDRAITETMLRKYDHRISQIDPGSPDYADEVAQLEAEKQTYQLSEYQKRVERFPNDLQLRFELGEVYFQAGKISEAIQEFQRAQANPHRKVSSQHYLARCFAKRRMYDLAVRTLQNAIAEKLVFDDEKKEMTYNLGCFLEEMGKKDAAIEQFKLIYEVDIGYRDVAKRVDDYYSGQSGATS